MSAPRLAVNQFMVPELNLDDLARWCGDTGVSGLGVLRGAAEELGAEHVRDLLLRYGLTPTSLCVQLGLVHRDPDLQAALLRNAFAALEDAARLGAPLVVVVGGPAAGKPLATTQARIREVLYLLAERAGELGARILLEPLNPAAVHLSAHTTLLDAAGIAATHPALGVVLDTWHVWTDPALLPTLAGYGHTIDVVHLSDWPADPVEIFERAYPGDGLIDLVGLCGAIRATGFTGWWEMEVVGTRLSADGPMALLDRSLAATRKLLDTVFAGEHADGRV